MDSLGVCWKYGNVREGGRNVCNSWILWVFVGNMGMRGREGGMCIIHNLSGSFLQTNKQTIPSH